jgi:hypothetical protein
MSSAFDAVYEAVSGGAEIADAALFEIDVIGSPVRLWTGVGERVFMGQTFYGLGDLIRAPDPGSGSDTTAVTTSITLSNMPGSLAAQLADRQDDVMGRPFRIYLVHFGLGAPWFGAAIHAPVLIRSLECDQLDDPLKSSTVSELVINLVNFANRRRRTMYPLYTASDQRARYPGGPGQGPDSACDFAASLPRKQIQVFT